VYVTEVVADNVRFLDRGNNDTQQSDGPIDISDDDLPY
jgi:single-stranded DNA-binding protein